MCNHISQNACRWGVLSDSGSRSSMELDWQEIITNSQSSCQIHTLICGVFFHCTKYTIKPLSYSLAWWTNTRNSLPHPPGISSWDFSLAFRDIKNLSTDSEAEAKTLILQTKRWDQVTLRSANFYPCMINNGPQSKRGCPFPHLGQLLQEYVEVTSRLELE